ncbi:MAG: ABC transporter permease [Chloroflexota bacterium]|nr:ABC transporter permease [Chloroflexota bacterium]
MLSALVRRTIWFGTVLLAVTTIVFGLIHLSGDPTDGFVDPAATPEVRAQIRADLGLDDPLPVQYLRFLANAVRGDFGESWRAKRDALELVLGRLDSTLYLAGTALGLALLLGLAVGAIHARVRLLPVRIAADLVMSIGQALPSFWVGAMLVLIFAVNLRWLPSSGAGSLQALVLPAITLALQPMATIARLTSTRLVEALHADFIRTARAKGLTERAVVTGHAMRASIGPVLAFVGVQIGFLIGGAVVVEGVFAWPGIGLLALNAVQDRDLPVIQCFVVVVAIAIMLSTTLVDICARALDPRIGQRGGEA